MQNELTRFARAFPTEDALIKSIATMLRRRDEISEVHILDSSHERGKDIVFYANSPMGQRLLHACVVKNKKIGGTVGSPYSPTTVLDQARQAILTPYLTPTGQEEYVSHVHVMSPYELPPASLYAIQNGMKGQVSFCCGGQLLTAFHLYWPDFLFDTGALGIYVTTLHKRIDKDDPVAVLFSEHSLFFGSTGALRKTYVEQKFHITLARFESDLQVPSIKLWQAPLRLENVEGISKTLRRFVVLLAVPHVTAALSIVDSQAVEASVSQLADSLLANWNAAYRQYERETLARKEPPLGRRAALIQAHDEVHSENRVAEILDLCQRTASYLKSVISTANSFSNGFEKVSVATLNSTGYLTYCCAQEIASLVPDIIRRTSHAEEVELPSTMAASDFGSVFITGAAGYGKSSFCFHNAKADADRLIARKSTTLPVYVKLHQLASRTLGPFAEEFYDTTELRVLANPSNKEAGERIKKVRIYLDGMDEIPRIERQREIMELARTAMATDPRITFVVTARDYVHGPWLNFMPRIKLSEFREGQIRTLVEGLLGEDQEQVNGFLSELEKVSSLKALMPVPLLATLIVSVYRKRRALPENRVKLYEIFLDLMCGGWDLVKNVHRPTDFGVVGKLSVLNRLAWLAHLNKKREFGVQEIKMAIRDTNSAFNSRYQQMLSEFVQGGILVKSGSVYTFKHLSFQEYLAAKDIQGDPSGKKSKQVLGWFLQGDEWWFQPLSFYCGMLGTPQETERWVLGKKPEYDWVTSPRIIRLVEVIIDAAPGYISQALPLLKRENVSGAKGVARAIVEKR
jgi:hypothetical protein